MDRQPLMARPGPLLRTTLLAAAVVTASLTLGAQLLLAHRYDEAAVLASRTPPPTAQAPAASQPHDRL